MVGKRTVKTHGIRSPRNARKGHPRQTETVHSHETPSLRKKKRSHVPKVAQSNGEGSFRSEGVAAVVGGLGRLRAASPIRADSWKSVDPDVTE